ncbi:MAG: SurA N-terminal domain-containing protein [Planctomycetes bacterium]|nr:SurA N-terminal domain-containing protein [Planctomycetota bacterium]
MTFQKIALCLLLVAPLGAGASAQVVARVNGEPIERDEFGSALVQSLGRAASESLIDRALLEQEAQARGVTVTEKELKERKRLELELGMRQLYRESRLSEEQFRQMAEGYGWKMDDLREKLAANVTDSSIRFKALAEKLLQPRLDLGEDALAAYFRRTRGPRYSAAHVVVESRQRAEQLLQQIKENPDSWTTAVLRYSLDRGSAPYKGRIPPVPADSELGLALANMQPNEVKLRKLDDGWSLLRRLEFIPAAGRPFEQIKDQLRAELLAVKADEQHYDLLADLYSNAVIVMNLSSDPGARRLLGKEAGAYVNGEPLLVSDMADALIERFGASMIWVYIEKLLISQEARRRAVTITAEEVDARLDRIGEQLIEAQAARRGMTPEEFEKSLAGNGITTERYKQMLVDESVCRQDVRAALLARKMVAGEIKVPEEELGAALGAEFGERVVAKEMTADSLAEAKRLYQRLKEGADFDLVRQVNSAAPGAWIPGSSLVTIPPSHPYFPYVKDLQPGELSPVFMLKDKYHILQVVRHPSATELPPLEAVRDELKRRLLMRKANQRIQALLLKLRAEADIEMDL